MPTQIPSVSTFTLAGVTSPYDPAERPTQAVAFWLGRDIARGVFEPLERLKIEQLSQFYGVGHSPVREAILLMSTSGLVIHEHQKGHRVAPVSLADYDDLLNVYMRIYRLALNMAMEIGSDEWEERVVLQLHRSAKVKKVLLDGDPQAHALRGPATDRHASAIVPALDSACRGHHLVALRVLNRRHEDLGRGLDGGLGIEDQLELGRSDIERHTHRLAGDVPCIGT